MRLTDRIPLYASAVISTADPSGLLDVLVERTQHCDDPGELLLIDDVLAALSANEVLAERVLTCQGTLRSRFGKFDPRLFPEAMFVRLPGGRFDLGSPQGQGEANEWPQHPVQVSAFAMACTPITVRQYRCFWPSHRMEIDDTVQCIGKWKGRRIADSDESYDDLPVTYASHLAARMFCRWLDWNRQQLECLQESEVPCLPSEAEWEFAVRAGAQGWSVWSCPEDRLDEHAWTMRNAQNRPHAVGRKHPNGFGLFDMHGQVWEWCEDAYRPYPTDGELRVDPLVLGSSAVWRVLRGGSFVNLPGFCRSAFRVRNLPAVALRLNGFRVVLAARSRAGLGYR